MLYAYDLDGTLCEHYPKREKPFFKQTGLERKAFNELVKEHCAKAAVIRQPQEPYIIISARPAFLREVTETWVKEHLPQPEAIYLIDRSRTRSNMIDFKAEMIEETGATVYFEDDPAIANALAKRGFNVCLVQNQERS